MTAAEALEAAVVAGFAIAVDCNDLVLEATSTPPAQVVDALLRQKVEVLALLRLEQSWSAPLDQPCPARRGRVEEQPNVQHFCAECGRWAAFGFGVSLRKGQLGRWYCAEHRPDRSGICAGTQCRGDQVPAVDVREQGTSPRGQLKLLQPANQNWTAEDWQRRFNERAAIAEQQQGMCRAEAERWAVECCVTEWLNGNPHPSPAGLCTWCGCGDISGAAVLPFGCEPETHAWLHRTCWPAWHQARRNEAIAALSLMGIQPRNEQKPVRMKATRPPGSIRNLPGTRYEES